jgi:hypothetical protein
MYYGYVKVQNTFAKDRGVTPYSLVLWRTPSPPGRGCLAQVLDGRAFFVPSWIRSGTSTTITSLSAFTPDQVVRVTT